MTKTHFIALADAVRKTRITLGQARDLNVKFGGAYGLGALREWESVRDALADFCAAQNPRFDRERWLPYVAGECGPNGGKAR